METTLDKLDGLTKEVYGNSLINLIPESAKLTKEIPFSEAEKIGKKFVQPVVLTHEKGVTFAAPGDGAFSLNDAVPMRMGSAEVDAYQMVLIGQMDYETASKAVSGGKAAFIGATKLQLEELVESATKFLELQMLYGRSGIGQGSSSANIDTTHTLVQVSTASWATGIWIGMEEMPIQFFLNSSGALISSGADSKFTIDSIDIDNRTLTVSGTTTGITDLDTALAAACDIFWYGARSSATVYKEMIGLNTIIANTTSTIFGISAEDYSVWKGNSYGVGSTALTLGKILSAISKPVARGLGEKATCLINDRTFANLLNDQSALRKYDGSYKVDNMENGAQRLTFHSQNGQIVIDPYNCVKEGDGFIMPLKRIKRIGSQDISFESLGNNGRIYRELDAKAGFEYRIYSNQQVFVETPARCLKLTGIVNS